ncbi:MAG: hypothetical protein V1839_01995 [archaeon]
MEEPKRMNFKEFITYLHEAGDPQYAQLHPNNVIEYCTSVSLMKIGVMPNIRDTAELRQEFLGFAAAIAPLSPEDAIINVGGITLPLHEKIGDLEAKMRANEITRPNLRDTEDNIHLRVFYQAKTPEEYKEISEFFESIPEDTRMPAKGQTFFGYD